MAKVDLVWVAITRSDGGLSLMQFVEKEHRSLQGEGWQIPPTPENINKEIKRAGLDCVSWRIIADEDVPLDRSFRNAWKDDGKISVDMPKAREIQKDVLRRERGNRLAALDIEFMRAIEKNDKKALDAIATRKQVLRDATDAPEIANAKTPEELKVLMLDSLIVSKNT
jgi:hypothetical protein